MKNKTRINRFISALLTIAVISACGLFAAAPEPVYAMNTTSLINHINNFDHGGTGSLTANISLNNLNIVRVTGTVTGATNILGLDINSGVTVQWAADYSGNHNSCMIQLSGAGTFEVPAGGVIRNNSSGGSAIFAGAYIDSTDSNTVTVSGGTVESSGNDTIFAGGKVRVNVSSGTVSGKQTVIASSAASSVNITGGTVKATGMIAIYAFGGATQVNVSGGFVFSCGTSITASGGEAVIRTSGAPAPIISGSAVVCAWNKPSGTPTYSEGTSTDLVANSGATVKWGKLIYVTSILYSNGANSGFYPISGVTVNPASTTYSVTVNGGSGAGSYTAGATVNIAAYPALPGKAFDKWTATGVTLSNPGNANTSFTMPANAVTVTATYKNATTYSVTVSNGTGSNSYAAGATVNIAANPAQAGKAFDKWTATGVTLSSPGNANTSFTMPANAVTVTATYKDAATYTVTFKYDNGEPDSVMTVNAGDKADYGMDPVKSGYTFAGWCSDAACTTA